VTATRAPAATTAAPPAGNVSPPALVAPAYNQAVSGVVSFAWLPTGPLPAGGKYEVVWWNVDEAPDAARGIAPPTAGTSLSADLGPLYSNGQFRNSQLFWSVIVVQENPYRRLTAPASSERGALYYSPAAGSAPPPPPK
jgi:hypothetical protein